MARNTFKRSDAASLHGYGRLAADATIGVTDAVESLHRAIARLPGPTRSISSFVYASIRAGASLAGRGMDAVLALATPRIAAGQATSRQATLRSALNGVYGDHLAATGNPLAIPMGLRRNGQPLTLTRTALAAAMPDAGGRVLVLVHGLCTNDLQWCRNGHDHGAVLARDLGYTPVYLHYNSGRSITSNAREFATLLELLTARWPVRLEELTILGHSMGGLLARGAVEAARAGRHRWLKRLRRLVFLGTPHHGALLEQLGSWVESALHVSAYSAPFARLGAARSAGITDLRHGSVAPLPAGIECYAIAATLGEHARPTRDQLIGDGLVPLDSALGRHRQPSRSLAFPAERQWIARHTSHLDLLSRVEVCEQLRKWLA